MGLLGDSWDDPRTAAMLNLAGGLLSQRNLGAGLVQGMQGYSAAMMAAKKAQQEEEERKQMMAQRVLQAKMLEAQFTQQQQALAEAKAQAARDDAFRSSIPSPQGQALQALGADASPTAANAARMPQVDPRSQLLFEALQARQIKPMDYVAATAPKAPEFQVVGDSLVQIGGGKVSEAYRPPPKPEAAPAAVREYLFAKEQQGYPGTFQQFQLEQRRAGATNIGLPKIDIKVGEGVAGQVGPLLKETREQALSGIKLVDSANRILEAAEKGNLYAGPTANLRLKGAQVADVLGIGGKDTKDKITNTRTVVRAMAEQGVAARSQLGGQAQISNSEQELLTRATSGDINDLTAGEIVQIATLNDRLGRQLYERHSQSLAGLKNTPNTQNLTPFFQVPELPGSFAPKRPGAPQFLGFEPQ